MVAAFTLIALEENRAVIELLAAFRTDQIPPILQAVRRVFGGPALNMLPADNTATPTLRVFRIRAATYWIGARAALKFAVAILFVLHFFTFRFVSV